MTLETLTHCGATYMVGIDGMSTDGRGSKAGRGVLAFGADELTTPVRRREPCPKCGKLVKVEVSVGRPI